MRKSQLKGTSGSGGANCILAIPVDQIGVWTSALCVIHCLLTPVVLSISAVSIHFIPSEERAHRTLAVAIAALGAIALLKGYRKHRSSLVLSLMVVGLAFIFGGAWWGDHLPSHAAEVFVTLIGSGFLRSAHRINHTFCSVCSCSHPE